jgi:hypothetical protein
VNSIGRQLICDFCDKPFNPKESKYQYYCSLRCTRMVAKIKGCYYSGRLPHNTAHLGQIRKVLALKGTTGVSYD